MGGLLRLPGIAQMLGSRHILKDHLKRLTVQQHEADHAVYKAMVTDTTLPLDIRLQVCCECLFVSAYVRWLMHPAPWCALSCADVPAHGWACITYGGICIEQLCICYQVRSKSTRHKRQWSRG